MKATDRMKEYWIDGAETCHKVSKQEFYRYIDVGFRGFILYPNDKVFWINNKTK